MNVPFINPNPPSVGFGRWHSQHQKGFTMTIKELEALHCELDYKYTDGLPSLNAFKKAKREGRLVARMNLQTGICRAIITGKDEGNWQVTEADMEVYDSQGNLI